MAASVASRMYAREGDSKCQSTSGRFQSESKTRAGTADSGRAVKTTDGEVLEEQR